MSESGTNYPNYNRYRRDHLPTLDGLRGLAVLLVLWAHLPIDSVPRAINLARYVFQPGYLGVDIFFVLSGFLITRILLVEKQNGRPLRNFLIRRSLRIFPIYYLTIVVLLFVLPGMYLLWSALYLSNFVFSFDLSNNPLRHTWSLAVEEHFYLVWPVLIYGCAAATSRRIALWVLMPLSVVLAILTLAVSDRWLGGHGPDLLYRATPFRMLSLLLGAMLAYHENGLRQTPGRLMKLALCTGLAAVFIIPTGKLMPEGWLALNKMIGLALASTTVVALSIWAFDQKSPVARPLSSATLSYLGRISYGIYLYHFPIFFFMGMRHDVTELAETAATVPTPWATILLAVAITFGVAAASFQFIERPILKLKDRFH